MSSSRVLAFVFVLALALPAALVVGCGPTDPVQQVIQERNQNYKVELAGWFPKKTEPEIMVDEMLDDMAEEMADEVDEASEELAAGEVEEAADELGEAAEEGTEVMDEVAEGPVAQTIVFDAAVVYQGRDPLPGITVEVAQIDAAQAEKGSWLQYLETGEMRTGESRQMSFEIGDILLDEGDAFSVTLLRAIAPEDYDRYPEIVAVSP